MDIKLKEDGKSVHVAADVAALFPSFHNICETTTLDCPLDLVNFIVDFAERYLCMDEEHRKVYSQEGLSKWASSTTDRGPQYTWYCNNFNTIKTPQLLIMSNALEKLGFEAMHQLCAFCIAQRIKDAGSTLSSINLEFGLDDSGDDKWY